MFSYLRNKLADEYHYLNLWYYVSFISGIVSYFTIRAACFSLYFVLPLFIIGFSLLLYLKLRAEGDKNIIIYFLTMVGLFFLFGILVGNYRLHNISTRPIKKIIIADITGVIESLRPTVKGSQLVLTKANLSLIKSGKNSSQAKTNRNLPATLEATTMAANLVRKVRINISKSLINKNFVNKDLKNKDFGSPFQVGDRISLTAKLYPLTGSILPGTYDFGFYLYTSGIEATGYALTSPKIIDSNNSKIIDNKTGDSEIINNKIINGSKLKISNLINTLRNLIYHRLIEVTGETIGNFIAAILIGETKAISQEVANIMRNSGIAHILSVSGLHLSLVALIFFTTSRVLLNCSNYLAYNINIKTSASLISIIGSFLYLLISGSNIAATRAFIMTAIFIIAVITGRGLSPLRSVMIAAFSILLIYPEYIFHPSWQLSFSAVLCLISGYEFYRNSSMVADLAKSGGIRIFTTIKLYILANIFSSFLASIVTAPFVIYHFYRFAVYSVIMNLIAVPLMSFFIMPLALLTLPLMLIRLDDWILKILAFFVRIIINLASYVVSLPGANWNFGYISGINLIIFTFGFFWLCLWQTSWRFWGIMIISIAIIMMFNAPKPDFIYDHRLKAIGLKDKSGRLTIYTNENIPAFNRDYWASWYGQENIIVKQILNNEGAKISLHDQLFTTGSGHDIALNYNSCLQADVRIMTGRKLVCPDQDEIEQLIISNEDLQSAKVILLYCNSKSKPECKAEYNKYRLWQ